MKSVKENISEKYQIDGTAYLPIVSDYFGTSCALDILLLRRDLGTVLVSGDLDGRVKTLIDALAIPVHGEKTKSKPKEDPNPFYCLMESDKLVSEIKIVADHLFATPSQVVEDPRKTPQGEYVTSSNHVCAVIHAKIYGDMQDFENKLT